MRTTRLAGAVALLTALLAGCGEEVEPTVVAAPPVLVKPVDVRMLSRKYWIEIIRIAPPIKP